MDTKVGSPWFPQPDLMLRPGFIVEGDLARVPIKQAKIEFFPNDVFTRVGSHEKPELNLCPRQFYEMDERAVA